MNLCANMNQIILKIANYENSIEINFEIDKNISF